MESTSFTLPDRAGLLVASEHHIPKEAQIPRDGKQHISPTGHQPADPTVPTRQHGHACRAITCAIRWTKGTSGGTGDEEPGLLQRPTGGRHDKRIPLQILPFPRHWESKDPERGWLPQSLIFCAPWPMWTCRTTFRGVQADATAFGSGPVSTLTDHAPHRSVSGEGAGRKTDKKQSLQTSYV